MANLTGSRSNFPQNIDVIRELTDLPANKKVQAQRYQFLKTKEVLSPSEVIELNNLTTELQDYLITADSMNMFGDVVISTQKFFKENVMDFVLDDEKIYAYISSHLAQMANLIKIKPNITILAANWVDDTANSGFWIYEIEDEDITENTMVDVNIGLDVLEKASNIKSVTDSFEGYVRLYAGEQPIDDIVADIRLIRQVVENEG